MSIQDQAMAALLSQLLWAADGAVLGIGLAYAAVRSILKFSADSSALRKIEQAPSIRVSDLHSLLESPSQNSDSDKQSHDGKLVIFRGTVEAKSAVEASRKSIRSDNVLVSNESGDKGVILQRTQTCIYNEGRGLIGWTSDLRSLILKSQQSHQTSSTRMVPFILVETGRHPQSDYVFVNMEGSEHPLPLTTIYNHLQPISASRYTFLQAIFGHEYPVAMLDEEKILPLQKEITAVGICSLRNGAFELKSCKDLPYFLAFFLLKTLLLVDICGFLGLAIQSPFFDPDLYSHERFPLFYRSDKTKEQMIVDLVSKSNVLLWSGVALGSIAIGILVFAAVRNWKRWKAVRQQRHMSTEVVTSSENESVVEDDDVPVGRLCVICLCRRRDFAFIPCGHLSCCQRCVLEVELQSSPKCPVCRQVTSRSLRIYDS